jgi:hypothetical protein
MEEEMVPIVASVMLCARHVVHYIVMRSYISPNHTHVLTYTRVGIHVHYTTYVSLHHAVL